MWPLRSSCCALLAMRPRTVSVTHLLVASGYPAAGHRTDRIRQSVGCCGTASGTSRRTLSAVGSGDKENDSPLR